MQSVTEETTRSKTEIAIYHGQSVEVAVRFQNEEAWTTQTQMAALFGRDRSVIGKHIVNVYEEGELSREATWAEFALVAEDGKTRNVDHFALDMALAVGFLVKSKEGTAFRKWAIKKLKTQADDQRIARLEAQVRDLESLVRLPQPSARRLPPRRDRRDPWADLVVHAIEGIAGDLTTAEILVAVGGDGKPTRWDEIRIGAIMRGLGFDTVRKRHADGSRRRVYVLAATTKAE